MKKYILFISITMIIFSTAVFGAVGDTSDITVSLLKYTPYPAEPGNYVTLTLKVENIGNLDADNVKLKIVSIYPFSLDSNSTVRIENSAYQLQVDSNSIVSLGKLPALQYALVDFNVRIASDALEGNRQLEIWSQPRSSDAWKIETFDILVQGTDRLEVSNVAPSVLTPGKLTYVSFILNNSGTAAIRDIIFKWSENDNKILPIGSGNIKYVALILPHDNAIIPFTLVADPSATSGVYTLNVNIEYIIGSNITKSLDTNVGMFIGGGSDFDVTMQESQAGSTSLSIANIGSNSASSVSVVIPNQDNFNVIGSSSSFVGNLNPGDFTLVSFQLTQKNMGNINNQPLKVDISYTDTNSNRQIIEKYVPVRLQAATTQAGQSGNQRPSSGLNFIIIGVIGVVLIVILIKYNRKIAHIFRKIRKSYN